MTWPEHIPTTVLLVLSFVLTLTAMLMAARRLSAAEGFSNIRERLLIVVSTVLLLVTLLIRTFILYDSWEPLQSHVDGLVLLSLLIAGATNYFQFNPRTQGVSIFAIPLLALMLLWAICASWWSWRPFAIHGVWNTFHLFCVYAGTAIVSLGAGAGVMYLFVDKQLKSKDHAPQRFRILQRLASLEMVERVVIHSATGGFVLITLALISGVVVATSDESTMGANWWLSSKVLLTVVAWLIYMLVMHVRFAPMFRGRRAAVLTIAGFVLIFLVMGIAQAINVKPDNGKSQLQTAAERYVVSAPEDGGCGICI